MFQKAQLTRASQHVVDQIKQAIRSGAIQPGDRLPAERELMQLFGVSRPTVREALRVLESLGLAHVRPGQGGTVVASPSSAHLELPLEFLLIQKQISLRDLVEFRGIMESANARWASERATDEDHRRLHDALTEAERHISDWARFHQADVQFHTAIADAAHNRLTAMVMKVIRDVLAQTIMRGWQALQPEQLEHEQAVLLRQHRQIFEAIVRRRPDDAEQAVREHLERFRMMVAEGVVHQRGEPEVTQPGGGA